jgi:DNA-binding transcriptional LysR family regulator
MDLHQLRAFIEVARHGNLTKAAGVLCLSQPAISAKIKSLEEEVGLRLFERLPQGMRLTHHGEVLLDEAKRTLCAADGLVTRARALGAAEPECIRLGTIGEPIALQFGEFLSSVLVGFPHATVSIQQGISGVVIEQVLADELDAGFVVACPREPGLQVVPLTRVRFLIAGPASWKEQLAGATWEQLAQFPWVGTPPKCSFNLIARELFARNNVNPRRVAEADQDNMLKSLVIRGVGLSILREDQALAAERAGDVVIWPHDHVDADLCYIQREDRRDTPVNRMFVSVLSDVWKQKVETAMDSAGACCDPAQ